MIELESVLKDATWPASRLGEAIGVIVKKTGLLIDPPEFAEPVPDNSEELATWMHNTGARLGIEIVPAHCLGSGLSDLLRRLGPSLLRVPGNRTDRFLVVLRGGSLGLTVLTPKAQVIRLPLHDVRETILGPRLEAEQSAVRALVSGLDLQQAVGENGLRALALERLRNVSVLDTWLIRPSPGRELRVHGSMAHGRLLLGLIFVTHGLATLFGVLLFWLIGRDAFDGTIQFRSVLSWVLCLFGCVPLLLVEQWAQNQLSLHGGAILKESLLHGVLQLDRATTRGLGIGQFLSMVTESEATTTAMQGVLPLLVSLIELGTALLIFLFGAKDVSSGLLLLAWMIFAVWLGKQYAKKAKHQLTVYRNMSHDLVERLVGYQTRLVQEDPEDHHGDEDALLEAYLRSSQATDRWESLLEGLVGPGWLILAMGTLVPALTSGEKEGATLALVLSGILLAARALKQSSASAKILIDVWVAWQQTSPILQAGRVALKREMIVPIEKKPQRRVSAEQSPLLTGQSLTLQYAPQLPAVLSDCSLQIRVGDRILLEGPSGGGKSTLATILAGLRPPDAGTLFLCGERSDRLSLDRWRAQVVLVPQFHDNHILTESLLFNLLLGRRWPLSDEDLTDAVSVCNLLGLGALLSRMPQGLAQTVGDGGWALSHGERSRVFLARALLQHEAKLIILDESFAALDPETLRKSCEGVLNAAPTLLVIAHP